MSQVAGSVPVSELALAAGETSYLSHVGRRASTVAVPFVDLVVDGTSLRAVLGDEWQLQDRVTGLSPRWPRALQQATLDDLAPTGAGHAPGVAMLVCSVCADRDCGALLADVTADAATVTWSGWQFTDYAGTDSVDVPTFVFDREAYTSTLAHARALIDALPYADVDQGRTIAHRWVRRRFGSR